jgi:hypothetical protein
VILVILCQIFLNKLYNTPKGQSRDTGNIGHKTQKDEQTKKHKTEN